MWRALAGAGISVEEVEIWLVTLLIDTLAAAAVPVELLSLWALLWLASAITALSIEVWSFSGTVVSGDALTSAFRNVPRLILWAYFWLALALAGFAIPEELLIYDIWAVLVMDTDALAGIKVPCEVLETFLSLADALTSGDIEDLILARAVTW